MHPLQFRPFCQILQLIVAPEPKSLPTHGPGCLCSNLYHVYNTVSLALEWLRRKSRYCLWSPLMSCRRAWPRCRSASLSFSLALSFCSCCRFPCALNLRAKEQSFLKLSCSFKVSKDQGKTWNNSQKSFALLNVYRQRLTSSARFWRSAASLILCESEKLSEPQKTKNNKSK